MAKTATKGKNKVKKDAAPAPAELEDEDEADEELDELDEDDAEDTPPKKSAAQEVVFGVSDLAKYLAEKSGKKVTPRELRTLIRKMARDESGRVNREITPGNRTRYNWSGLGDPEVKAIIKAFNAGELEEDKQAKLQALKDRKAQKTAEKKAAEADGDDEVEDEKPKAKAKAGKKAAGKKKKAKVEVVEVEDDDDEELELDEDDE
jgi:hypothetical protein